MKAILLSFNKHLPLNIMGVQPISAEFRGTSVFAPIVTIRDHVRKKESADSPWHNVHHPLRPIYGELNFTNNPLLLNYPHVSSLLLSVSAILQIQSSGKWPKDNYSAFLHMKRLFLLRIKELLVYIGVPSKVVSTGMLDVFINGLIFRLSFCHNFELKLLRLSLGLIPPKRTEATIDDDGDDDDENPITFEPEPLARWLTFNQRLPDVASRLVAVARSHINTFPDACRLAKRWLSAHGFPVVQCPDLSSEPTGIGCPSTGLGDADLGESECRLSEIAIELMVVHAGGFTKAVSTPSYTAGLPGASDERFLSTSPLATFLRFLRLLYSFDWEKDILLVDLNEEFTGKEGLERAMVAVTEFKITPRDQLPAMVIGTPLDPKGTHWTRDNPSAEGLKRLQVLAMHSYELLRAMLVAGADLTDLKAVFRPDLSQMDVLIKLRPSVYKTRILEAVDLEVPSWAIKKTDYTELETPSGDEGTQESEPVTLDLPHPGASYWPAGYLCDPVTWILRHIQITEAWLINQVSRQISCVLSVHRLRLNIFEYLWDRHCGRWIGLRIKDVAKCTRLCELKPFNETNLCQAGGFGRHRESTSNSMGLVVDVELALQALETWGSEMLESVRLQRPEVFKMAGVELQAPDVEVVSRLNPEKTSESESENKGENERKSETVIRKKKMTRRVVKKKKKRAKFQP
ncbi:hypothetical protein Aperf_G00000036996 [Anoplocephala perfoliata]